MDDALDQWLRTEEDLALLLAHDLRNPLAAIVANLSFLEMVVPEDDADSQESLRDLRHSADQVLRLVENLAAVARLESPRSLAIPRAAVPLAPVFAAVTARHKDDGAVSLTIGPCPADLAVLADAGYVEGVVDNLARNALRHVRRGHAARLSARAAGGSAEITLEDDAAPFAGDGADFTREAQLRLRHAPDGRYGAGAGLYVIGLVARVFGGGVSYAREGAVGRLTVTLPLAP